MSEVSILVYSISIYSESGLNAKIYEGLKDYKVEDILSHNGEMYSVFEVLLKANIGIEKKSIRLPWKKKNE